MADATNAGRQTAERAVESAYLAALRSGPIRAPLTPLSDAELDAPFDCEDGSGPGPAEEDHGPAAPLIVGYRCAGDPKHGGQATVFRAVQSATGQRVAVKVLHGGRYLSAAARDRFEREADALAAIGHPNVVRIVDRGRTADGSFYLVTPYVDGRPLDDHAADARAAGDAVAIVRLLARVAGAVAAAHAAGVVHRDLKPSNILIDARGEPHVIDFGLARMFDPGSQGAAASPTPTVTAAGQIVGSLPWSSPEQAAGRSNGLTPASDVYALGVLLFQSLTGLFPYDVNGDLPDVIDRIRHARPHRPSRTASRWDRLDRAAVDAVVLKALAKDPVERYASAAELGADLERLLDGRPPAAPRLTYARVHGRGVRVAAACALAALVASGAVHLWRSRPDPGVVPLPMPARANAFGMRMVRLPAGQFTMGSSKIEDWHAPGERLKHAVVPRPIWVSATEVTRGQYAAVTTGDTAALLAPDANLPVTDVTRAQAEAFCRLLSGLDVPGYRLPDEVEWEYACRAGGEQRPFAGTGRLSSMGWYSGNSGGRLQPVATLSPNAWGLYDLHGNAREWCGNRYARGYDLDPHRPAGSYPLLAKGGSYLRPEGDCRAAARQPVGGSDTSAAAPDLGFRVVRDEPGGDAAH